ncbi:MAG: glycosyl hydrolase, partial [Terracidiphilus sp.]
MYFPATSAGPSPPPGYMGQPGFSDLLAYVRRMSYLMAMGRPDASVALFLPSSSMWLGDDVSDTQFVSAERLLGEHQIDFDIVDEDALARDMIALKGSFQTLSGSRYRTVILPAPSVLSSDAFARLKVFAQGGGKVVFLGGTPRWIASRTIRGAEPAKVADFSWATVVDALLPPTPTPPANPPASPPTPQIVPDPVLAAISAAVVEPAVRLDAVDTALKVMKRRWKDADVYLFFNEGNQESEHAVTLFSKGHSVEVWDAQTGSVSPLDSTSIGGHLNVRLNLHPYETQLLVVR